MDENNIKIGIENTVAQSPVTTQKQASKNIEAPDGQSTFVTGDLEGNVADQTVTTPDRGIAFTKDTTEVYTGGTALPNLNYDTRRQTPADRGNPLYFEPNYQPVVPFNVQTPYGNVASTTLDPEKLAWQIAVSVAGRGDDGYIGYKEMPTAGTLGWGSHWLGAAKQFTYNLIPEMSKGGASLAAGAPAAAFRGVNSIEKDYLADMYGMKFDDGEERKPSAIAASMRARGFTPSEEDKQEHLARLEEGSLWADGYQYVQDQVDASMNWAENHYGNTLVADALDNSGKAQTAAGVASGMVNFGAALLAHDPKGVFTLLNFASQSQMRKNALDSGVSPAWATAYSFGGAGVNSLLDMFQFEAITGGFALTRKAVYQQIAKEGVYKFHLGKALGRNALDMFVVEPTTEMIQEGIEGAYDPEFLAHPDDRLVVAAISAMAVKAAGLPSAVRHARAEERLAVAKALGVDTAYLSIVKEARDTLNNWVKQGKFDADKVDQTMEMIISRAPDAIAKEIRDGVLGQFNKVSMKERSEFADALTNVNPNSISMQQFNKLDTRVDDALKEIALPDSQKTMIKGVVRGLAQLKLLQDGTAPSEINVPNFVLTPSGDSSYNAETNTITISLGFSGTIFSKTRANANARDDENFNNYLRPSFIPSSRQSNRMSTVLHELAHWIDYQIGETGFGDFLEAYYNNIAEVFGNDRALSVYKRTKKGADRFGRIGDKDTSTRNASEWNAQAVGRLGKRVAEQFGLGKSKAQRFLSYANMVFNQVATWTDPKQLKESAKIFGDFQTAMQDVAKENMDTIKDLVDVFGEDGIKAAVKDFLSGAGNPNEDLVEYLARNDMLRQLFNVMDSFADNVGLEQIGKLFDSKEEMRSFVEQGDIYFNSGYDDAVAEVQERRKQLQERRAKKEGAAPQTTTASNNMRQVTLSNGTVVSVPKNVKPLGNDQITEDDLNGKKNTQNEFVGEHAALPITEALTQAQTMMEEKASAEDIFKKTGWFLDNKDNRWKYEIPAGEIKTSMKGETGNSLIFADILYNSPELFKAYPVLKYTPIFLYPTKNQDRVGASTHVDKDGRMEISITYDVNNADESIRHELVHELQHAVQVIEGFAVGGYQASAGERGYNDYRRLAGEIEARNAARRADTNKLLEGLGNTKYVLPTQTQDISDSDAIIKFGDVEIAKHIPEKRMTQEERQTVYTGSPNVYDTPDLNHKGTGMGMNIHGSGLYWTGDKDSAKLYWHQAALRQNLVPITVVLTTKDGEQKFVDLQSDPVLYSLFKTVYKEKGAIGEDRYTWYDTFEFLKDGKVAEGFAKPARMAVKDFVESAADSANISPNEVTNVMTLIDDDFGQVLKGLSPDTDRMLIAYAEPEEQSEYVQKATAELRKWFAEHAKQNPEREQEYLKRFDKGGESLYNAIVTLAEEMGGAKFSVAQDFATHMMRAFGIDGMVYGDDEMVIFNPEQLDVLEKIRGVENIEQYERLPNDYVNDEDPTEEVRLAYENGKQADVDEKPSYDLEVDGRKVGEDIASMTKGIMKRAENLPNKIVKWAASSPFGWGIDRIMITMFGRDVAEQFDVQGKYSARNTLRSQAYTRFMKKLEPIIGNIETDKTAAMFKYKTMLNQLGFVRVSGVELNNPVVPDLATKKDLTGWEVMYVYLMKRMGPKFANRIQQKTRTNIDELISTLTEEEKQFANAMSDTLREIWIERVGRERAMWNYFPIMDDEHSFFDETSIDNFRQRMETDKPIAIEDAGRLFSKEISRLASWDSGYYRTLKRLRDVLQYKGANGRNIDPDVDGELKKASGILAGQIKDIFGVDGYHNLLRLLDMQIADPQEQMLDSAASKTMQQMGNNIIRGLLSFKFLSFPKNLVNITMMWGGAKDQATYWNGFAEGISDLSGTWKYMMKNSEQIRERYDNIGYNEFLDQRNTGGSTAPVFKGASKVFAKMDWTGDKTGGMAKMSAVLDMLGETGLKMFMLNGDAVANIYGGYGLIKDYMAQGLSEKEAFKKLDRYIAEHQSSSNMAMKPLRQLEANKSLAGQLMAFTSEGVVKGASILGTFDEVKMGTATKSEAIANALSIAASMALFALIGAGAWDLWDDDEKVRDEAVKALEGALVDQVFGFSVLGNGFITPMVQNLLGLGGQSGISAPIWSVATEGIGNLKRGEYDRIITKALEASGLLVGANALYNDLLGMMMVNSDDPDVRDAGFRMLMGHTIGYAEKRTGAELRNSSKENVENKDEE